MNATTSSSGMYRFAGIDHGVGTMQGRLVPAQIIRLIAVVLRKGIVTDDTNAVTKED